MHKVLSGATVDSPWSDFWPAFNVIVLSNANVQNNEFNFYLPVSLPYANTDMMTAAYYAKLT